MYTEHTYYSKHRTSDIEIPCNFAYGKGTTAQSKPIPPVPPPKKPK